MLKYKFDFENETLTSMIIKMVIKLRFPIVSESIKIIYNIFIKIIKRSETCRWYLIVYIPVCD